MEKSYSIPGFKDVSVGASDSVILGVSIIGLGILSVAAYHIIIRQLKSADEIEQDELSPEELLAKADVSSLSRAQRRARAKLIMKEERRANIPMPNNENEEGGGAVSSLPRQPVLSRKERQKAAKLAEQRERKLNFEARKKEQEIAQKVAKQKKEERQRVQALEKQREEERQQEEQRQAELEKQRSWSTFLVPSKDARRSSAQTVEEFVQQFCDNRRCADLKEIADSFGVSIDMVRSRIQTLVDQGRVAGFFDDTNHRFVHVSDDELRQISDMIMERGTVSVAQVAEIFQKVIS